MELIAVITLLLSGASAACAAASLYLATRGSGEKRLDDKVQAAMDDAAEEEARKSKALNEGIENVMSYEVKLGWGKKTGGDAL